MTEKDTRNVIGGNEEPEQESVLPPSADEVSSPESDEPVCGQEETEASPEQQDKETGKRRDKSESAAERKTFEAEYQLKKEKELEKLSREIEGRHRNSSKAQKRKWWIKTVLLLLLCAVSFGIMLTLGNYITDGKQVGFVEMVQNINVGYFLALLLILVLQMIFESAKYSYLLKISTGKFRIRNAIKTMFVGRYYDGITPFSTGGQPFQIYYLHKKDIPAGAATSIPLARFIVSTILWCLMSVCLMAIAPYFLRESANVTITTSIYVIAWVSLAVNLIVPLVVVFVSVFPKGGKKLLIFVIGILKKLHIVKDKYRLSKKYLFEVQEYSQSIKLLIRKWWLLIPLVILSIGESLISFSIPFFVVISIANIHPTWELLLQIMCLCCISQFSASLIPTPGTSGAVETTASLVFVTISGIDPVIGWVIFAWRFFTYYLYILSGIGINIFEIIRSAIRNKRASKAER